MDTPTKHEREPVDRRLVLDAGWTALKIGAVQAGVLAVGGGLASLFLATGDGTDAIVGLIIAAVFGFVGLTYLVYAIAAMIERRTD